MKISHSLLLELEKTFYENLAKKFWVRLREKGN